VCVYVLSQPLSIMVVKFAQVRTFCFVSKCKNLKKKNDFLNFLLNTSVSCELKIWSHKISVHKEEKQNISSRL